MPPVIVPPVMLKVAPLTYTPPPQLIVLSLADCVPPLPTSTPPVKAVLFTVFEASLSPSVKVKFAPVVTEITEPVLPLAMLKTWPLRSRVTKSEFETVRVSAVSAFLSMVILAGVFSLGFNSSAASKACSMVW